MKKMMLCIMLSAVVAWLPIRVVAQAKKAVATDATLTVEVGDIPVAGNTLQLIVIPQFVYGPVLSNILTEYDAVGVLGRYTFHIPHLSGLAYCMLLVPYDSSSVNTIIRLGDEALIEPGDRQHIVVKRWLVPKQAHTNYDLAFSGPGSLKNTAMEQARRAAYRTGGSGLLVDSGYAPVDGNIFHNRDRAMREIIERYRGQVSDQAFDQLLTDVAYMNAEITMNNLRILYIKAEKLGKTAGVRHIIDSINAIPPTGSVVSRARSRYYGGFMIRKLMVDQLLAAAPFSYNAIYGEFKKLPTPIRDRLIVQLLATYNPVLKQFDSLLVDARTVVRQPPFDAYVDHFGLATVGSPAVDFSLRDRHGKMVQMADFRGKVVVMDFWFTGCLPCMNYYKNVLQPTHERFEDNTQVVFVSVSVDKNRQQWVKSIDGGKYTGAGHINLYTNGAGTDHPLIKEYNLAGYPSPILIGADGRIAGIRQQWLYQKQPLIDGITQLLAEQKNQDAVGVAVIPSTQTSRSQK